MKKYLVLVTLFFGVLLFFSSCTKEDTEPQMNLNNIVAPSLSSPATGGQYILDRLTPDSLFDHFTWSEANYPLNTIPQSLYAVECALSETDFATVYELGATTDLSLSITQSQVNDAIVSFIGGEFPQDTVVGVEFRIKAAINANNVSDATNVYSETIASDVTPYPMVVEAPPLYLIGDGTTIGWDNENTDLQFTFDPVDEVYKIIATLGGSGLYIKAFEVPGQWAPQWGTDATGTSEGGPLVYRPDEETPDPTAIPTPEEAGDYLITFDLANEVYTIEVADIAATMHIIGDATEAGWDNTLAIPMEKLAPGKFQLVANLNADATEGFKFLVDQGAWAPMYGTDDSGVFESGVLVYRETEADPDPRSIPPPASTGSYLIEIDIIELTYSVTPQ